MMICRKPAGRARFASAAALLAIGAFLLVSQPAEARRPWWDLASTDSAVLTMPPSPAAPTVSATWNGTTDNLWATAGNWTVGGPPGTGDTATFNNAGNGNTTLDLGAGVTVKTILFDTASAAAYTIGSGAVSSQSLILNAAGGILVSSTVTNNQLFNAAITLDTAKTGGNAFTFTNDSTTATLTIAGNIAPSGVGGGSAGIKTLTLTGSGNGSISGIISGTGAMGGATIALTKSGTGTWTLSGTNTYGGGTTINSGTILAGNNTALGSATVKLGDTSGSSSASLLTNGAFTIGNAITVQSGNTGVMTLGGNTASASSFSGNISLGTASGTAKGATFVALAGGTVTFSGVINESTSVPASSVIIGDSTHSGTVKFSNVANQYGGTTTITNGATLEVVKLANGGTGSSIGNSGTSAAAGSAASDLVIDGSTLKYTGTGDSTNRLFTFSANGATIDASASANGALNFTGTGSLVASGTGDRTLTLTGTSTGANTMTSIIANPSTGATSLTKSGAGTWVISGANTYSGDTTISSGVLRLGAANRIPDGTGKGNVTVNGTLDLNTFSETINGLSGAGIIDTVAGGTPTLTVGNNDATSLFSGVIQNTAGTLALTKIGTGTFTVAGANTYSGGTTVNAGTLQASGSGTFGSSSGSLTVNTGGTVDLNGTNQTVGALNGSGGTILNDASSTTSTLTVGNGNASGSYAGVLADNSGTGGILAFTKIGAGTQTLTGTNTYTGATTVNGGTLFINGDQTAATGAATVSNSGTVLGGTGIIGGPVTVNAGAAIQGGTGTTGASQKLTVNNSLTLNDNSIIKLALGGGGSHSTLARTGSGTWTFDSNQAFTFIELAGTTTGPYDNIITGLAVDPGTTDMWTITNPNWMGTFTYENGNIDLNLIAVPEPSTWAAASLALVALLVHQRRRLRKLVKKT